MLDRHNIAFFPADADPLSPSPATNTPLRQHQPTLETGMLNTSEPYPIGIITSQGLGLTESSAVTIGPVLPTQPLGEGRLSAWVNIASGNLVVQTVITPIFESGRLLSAGFFYNSIATPDTAFTFSLDRRIDPRTLPTAKVPSKMIALREGDGNITSYLPHPSIPNLYFAPGCGHGTPFITYDAALAQSIHHHPGTGMTSYFNAQGECLYERDCMGRELHFEYANNPINGQPRLFTKFYRPEGGTSYALSTATISGKKFITLLQQIKGEPDRILQQHTLNPDGCIIQTTLPNPGGATPYTLNFSYAVGGNRTYLDTISQSDGTQITFDFEPSPPTPGAARRIRTCRFGNLLLLGNSGIRFTYDNARSNVMMEDWMSFTTLFTLDAQSRLSTQTHYTTGKRQGAAPREITRYTYAATGQLASLTTARGGTTQYEYNNAYGLCTRVIRPNNQIIAYSYDVGDLSLATDEPLEAKEIGDGAQTALMEDLSRRPNCTSIARYAIGDSLQSAKTIRHVYDRQDLLANKRFPRFIISPTGCLTEYQPDERGNIKSERMYSNAAFDLSPYRTPAAVPTMTLMQTWLGEPTQNKSHTALTEYLYTPSSALGRRRRFTELDAQGAGIENATFEEINYRRDTFGRIALIASRENADQPEAKQDATTDTTATTRYQYDGLTRLIKVTDALGNVVETNYADADSNGHSTVTRTQPNGRRESTVTDSRGTCVETREDAETADGTRITRSTLHRPDASSLWAVTTLPDQTLRLHCYDGLRRPLYEISHTGRVIAYHYDAQNGIQSVIRYDLAADPSFTAFWPDRNSFPSWSLFEANVLPALAAANPQIQHSITDLSGRLQYTIDESGALNEIRYDGLDRPVAQIAYAKQLTQAELRLLLTGTAFVGPAMPDPRQDRCTQTLYDENTAYPTYLPLPLLEDTDIPASASATQDAAGYITRYQRDAGGRLIARIQYHSPLPVDISAGIPLSHVVPDPDNDARHVFVYDGRHQCIQETDPDGFLTSHRYFASGALNQTIQNDRITHHIYDLLRRLITRQDSQGRTQMWQYNNMSQVTLQAIYDATQPHSVDPEARREQRYRYDGFNALIAQTNSFGGTTHHVYEPLTGVKQSSTDPLNQTTFYYYDIDRRLCFEIGASFEITETIPDIFDRTTTTRRYLTLVPAVERPQLTGGFLTPALRQILESLQTPQDESVKRTFDPKDRVLTETDPEGVVTDRSYNAFGDCETEDLPSKEDTVRIHITHVFEPRGLEILTTRHSGALETKVTYKYDTPHGKETLRIDENGARWQTSYHRRPLLKFTLDPAGAKQSREYDFLGRILSETDAQGAQTTHHYDEQTRMHETRGPVAGVYTQTIQNVFHETVIQRDPLGETHLTHTYDGQIAAISDPLQRTTTHQFNLIGLKTQTTLPNGAIHLFEYDALQRLVKYTEDATGIARTETTTYLDPLGQHVRITNARNIVRVEERDRRGLLISTTTDPTGLALQTRFAYTPGRTQSYQLRGNTQQPEQAHTQYNYDPLNRRIMTNVDPNHLALKSSISLDAAGLVRRAIDPMGRVTWHFYDDNQRPVITIDPMGGIKQTRYDANGNTIQTRHYATHFPAPELAELTLETPTARLLSRLATLATIEDIQIYTFYDTCDRPQFEVTGLGKLRETTYNAAHRPIQTRGYTTQVPPELIPTLTTETLAKLAKTLRNDVLDETLFSCFDAAKQLRYQIDTAGCVTEQRYDASGERIAKLQYSTAVPDPAATAALPLADIPARIQQNAVEDRITLTFFDALPQPIFLLTPADGLSPTGHPLYQVKQLTYDAAGNQITSHQYATRFEIPDVPQTPQAWSAMLKALRALPTAPQDRIEQAEFDAADRNTVRIDSLGYREIDTLDALGQVTAHSDKAKNLTHHTWDTAGRLLSKLSPAVPVQKVGQDTTTNMRIETCYTYDECSRVLTSMVGNGELNVLQTLYAYNPCGQLIRTDVSAPNLPPGPVSTTRFYRNAQQRVIGTQNPSKSYVLTLYDADEQLRFTIDGTGAIIAYQTNGVGDRITQHTYATRLPDGFQYQLVRHLEQGIPIPTALVNDALVPSDNDGIVRTEFNHRREPVRTRTLASPGFEAPQTNTPIDRIRDRQYTAFGEIRMERDIISTSQNALTTSMDTERLHLYWYNRAAKPIAEYTPEKRVIRTQYNAFSEISCQSTRATAPQINVSPNTSVAELDAAHVPSTADQTFEWQHDLRGKVTEHRQKDVQIQELAEDKTQPSGYRIDNRTTDLTTTYLYDPLAQEICCTQPNGGKRITYRDALCRTIAETDVARPVRMDNDTTTMLIPFITTQRNLHGTALEIRIHAQGLTQADPGHPPTLPNDPNDRVTRFTTDELNRVVSKTIDPEAQDRPDPLNIVTRTRYSATHQIAATIDAEGVVSRTFYDAEHRPCIKVDALGGVTTTDYDAFGRIVSVSQYGSPLNPDSLDNDTTTETVRNYIAQLPQDDISTTRILHDQSNLVRFTINPIGAVTEQRYDLAGFSRQTIAYKTPAQTALTDIGAAIAWAQAHAQSALDAITDIVRDAAGMARFIIDPEDCLTQQTFNTHNQLTQRIQYTQPVSAFRATLRDTAPDSFASHLTPDPTTDTAYDATYNGHLKTEFEVFGEENVTRTCYDMAENLIATMQYATIFPRQNIPNTPAEEKHEEGWVFADSTIEEQLREHTHIPLPTDRLETHGYTLAKQKTRTTDSTGHSDYFYQDIFGNLTLTIDRNAQPWRKTLDKANRLIQTQAPPTINTRIVQNANGNLEIVSEETVSALSVRVLDKRGLPIACIEAAGLPEERRMTFTYHPVTHAILTSTLPNQYIDNPDAPADFIHRPETLTTITTTKHYNTKLLLIADEHSDGGQTRYQHNLAGEVILSTDPRGAVVAYTRDTQGQVIEERHYATLTPDDRIITYTYDRRRQLITETKGSVFYAIPLPSQTGALQTGTATPRTHFQYRFDGQCVRRSSEQFNDRGLLTQTYTLEWFDRNGQSAARILPQGATTLTTHNAFGEVVSRIEYATPLTSPPPLDQAFDPSILPRLPQDRVSLSTYDLLGRLTQEQRPNTILGMDDTTGELQTGLWQRSYQYATPTATQEQPSAICNEEKQWEYFYYNARQQRTAIRGITFTTPDLFGSKRITPLTFEKRNVFGEQVGSVRFANGMNPTTDPNQYPTPLQTAPTDVCTLTLRNASGKPIAQQNPENNVTAVTYTKAGKLARSFYRLTNPVSQLNAEEQPVITEVVHLDERRFTYDLNQNTVSATLLRNHAIVDAENDCLYTTYNAFNEPTYEGPPSQPQATYWRYDVLGRLWSTNVDGLSKLYTNNLGSNTGQETARLTSATRDLAQISYSDLPDVVQWSHLDLEIEAFVRNPVHAPIQQFLPQYDNDIDKPDPIPISMVSQQTKLTWVLPQERNVSSLRFTLALVSNPGRTFVLPVNSQADTCSVDVSHLPTDQYTYVLEGFAPRPPYTSADPLAESKEDIPLVYYTKGTVQFITDITAGSTEAVPKVVGTRVILYGDNTNITRIRLMTADGTLVAERDVTPDPQTGLPSVVLADQPSGDYSIIPLSRTGDLLLQTLPFRLHTPLLSPTPLSREIDCTTQLAFFDTFGELTWTVPDDLQANEISITVHYITPGQTVPQQETFVLDHTTDHGKQTDSNGNTLHCNLQFSQPVETVLALTFAVSITYHEGKQWVMLRREELPMQLPALHSSEDAEWEMADLPPLVERVDVEQFDETPNQYTILSSHTGIIQTVKFLARDLLYITPLRGYQDDQLPVFSILNTSLDTRAEWETVSALSANALGLVLDMSAYPTGIYPFVILQNAQDNSSVTTLHITRGGTIYPSDNQENFHAARWTLRSRASLFRAAPAFSAQLREQTTAHRTAMTAFLAQPMQHLAAQADAQALLTGTNDDDTPPIALPAPAPFSAAENAAFQVLSGNVSKDLTRPTQSFAYDVFGNLIRHTDPLGNATQKQYGSFGQVICLTQAAITTVDEHGVVHPDVTPKTFSTYNFLNMRLTETDPNGHTTHSDYDENNQEIRTILGDGTLQRTSQYDALSCEIAYINASQQLYRKTYDRRGLLTSTQTPLGRVQSHQYNALGYRAADINPIGATQRYAYDVRGNITGHIDPLGYQTIRISDRNAQPLFEQKPDNTVSRWTRNYFGRVATHTALNGQVTTHTYDLKNQCTQTQTSEPGGPNRIIKSWVKVRTYIYVGFTYIPITYYLTKNIALHGQTNTFTYHVGRLIMQNDSAKEQVMQFGHNIAGQRISARSTTYAGTLMQFTRTVLDPLNRESWSFDSSAIFSRVYDPAGNCRHIEQTVSSTDRTKTIDAWYLHDDANRVVINNGALVDGNITITPRQGKKLTYNNNLRTAESTTRSTKQLGYDNDDRLTTTTNFPDSSTRRYRADNNVTQYTEKSDGKTTRETLDLNTNGWITTAQQVSGKDSADTTFSNYTPTGLFGRQRTTYSGPGNNQDDIRYLYLAYGDTTLPRRITGTRTNDYGQSTTVMEKIYDFIGAPNAVDAGRFARTYFETAADGHILTAWQTNLFLTPPPVMIPLQRETGLTRYFYDVNNNAMLGSYSSIYALPLPLGSNGLHWALTDGISQSVFGAASPILSDLFSFLRIQSPLKMVTSSYPPRAAEHCVVGPGDTFESLSVRHFGDPSYADLIANANGMLLDSPILAGQVLSIPQVITAHNTAHTVSPYEAFVSALMNQFTLRLDTPQPPPPPPPKSQSFFQKIVGAIINTVAIIVGGGLAALTPFTGGVSLFIAASIIGMATHATLQAATIIAGLENKFSLREMIQIGLTAGLMAPYQAAKIPTELLAQLKMATQIAVLQQATELATGLRKTIDFQSIIVSIVAQVSRFQLSQLPMPTDPVGAYLQQQTTDTLTAMTLNSIQGKLNFEDLIANAIGSSIGYHLGNQAVQAVQTWQAKASLAAQQASLEQQNAQISHEYQDTYYEHPNKPEQKTTSRTQTNAQQTTQPDPFLDAITQQAIAMAGGTLDDYVRDGVGKQLMIDAQMEQAGKTPHATPPPMSTFMDYVQAVNDSAFIANFNRDFAAAKDAIFVHPVDTAVGFWNSMQAHSANIMHPDTSLWERAKSTAILTFDVATVAVPVANAGLKVAGAALTSAATALQHITAAANAAKSSTARITVSLGHAIVDNTAAALTNAQFMQRSGFFGRSERIIEVERVGNSAGAFKRLDYEAAPYHRAMDNSLKNRAPINGQNALDTAVRVKSTSPRRVGIDYETGDFVVFDKTWEHIYHGHVRAWHELHLDMQRALQNAGMVNRRGYILQQIKNYNEPSLGGIR